MKIGDNMDKQNKTLISRFGFNDPDLTTPLHDKIILSITEDKLKEIISNIDILKGKNYKIHGIAHEVPIKASNDYIIGFIDAVATIAYDNRQTCDPMCDPVKFIKIYIEVKTTIPSYGELVRQLNMYRDGLSIDDVYTLVISPDDRFASALKDQGILFYKYEIIHQPSKPENLDW